MALGVVAVAVVEIRAPAPAPVAAVWHVHGGCARHASEFKSLTTPHAMFPYCLLSFRSILNH